MSNRCQSDATASTHDTMEALLDVGAIDEQTLRRFEPGLLPYVRLDRESFQVGLKSEGNERASRTDYQSRMARGNSASLAVLAVSGTGVGLPTFCQWISAPTRKLF